jgi:DNA-binding XRE family transcriptional regulator
MWEVYEHRRLDRRVRHLPSEVLKRYEKWKQIVRYSGPSGLKAIHDYTRTWPMAQRQFRKARRRIKVSVGESVRIVRELQELSQNQLAALTGIPQSTISAIENDRVNLGVERAKVLARALHCHPAVLVFPDWDVDRDSVA